MARLWSQPCNALSAWINTVFCYAGQNGHLSIITPHVDGRNEENKGKDGGTGGLNGGREKMAVIMLNMKETEAVKVYEGN